MELRHKARGKISLRRFTPDDAEKIFRMSRENSLVRFLPDQVYSTYEEASQVVDALIRSSEEFDPEAAPYVLGVVLDDRELIGHVGFSKIDAGIEIGYAIAERVQGCGYAQQAVSLMLERLAAQSKIRAVYGVVDPDNAASKKVLERCGFFEEGRKSDRIVYKKVL